jgi:hypothetical protein
MEWDWHGGSWLRGRTDFRGVTADNILRELGPYLDHHSGSKGRFMSLLDEYLKCECDDGSSNAEDMLFTVHTTVEIYIKGEAETAITMFGHAAPLYRGAPRYDYVAIRGGDDDVWHAQLLVLLVLEDTKGDPMYKRQYRIKDKKSLRKSMHTVAYVRYFEQVDAFNVGGVSLPLKTLQRANPNAEYGFVELNNILRVSPVEGLCRGGSNGDNCKTWVVNRWMDV